MRDVSQELQAKRETEIAGWRGEFRTTSDLDEGLGKISQDFCSEVD
jgi:hypothetical protein